VKHFVGLKHFFKTLDTLSTFYRLRLKYNKKQFRMTIFCIDLTFDLPINQKNW